MLDRRHRLTRSADFTRATRSGRRAGTPTLVLSACADPSDASEPGVRVGFAVGRSVGTAVVRNRVKRRLRHLVRERLAAGARGLEPGSSVLLVVRALPAATAATSRRLGADLDTALERLARASGDVP